MCRTDFYIQQHCCGHVFSAQQQLVPVGGCRCCGVWATSLVRSLATTDHPCHECWATLRWVPWHGSWFERGVAEAHGWRLGTSWSDDAMDLS